MVRLLSTGQIGYIYSYFENGTLSVVIDAEKSFLWSGCRSVFGTEENYRVFGLYPKDIEKIENKYER